MVPTGSDPSIALRRNLLEIPSILAGLLTAIAIGLIVENRSFRVIEARTVPKRGLQH